MTSYSYRLYKNNKNTENKKNTYKKRDLKLMTTFQLREICIKEKIVKSLINPLDKEELINLIMKYRGEEDSLLINNFREEGLERVERFLKKSEKLILDDKKIEYPGKITVYKELDTEIYDGYRIQSKDKLEEVNMFLVDSNFKICSVFNVKKINESGEDKYFLTSKGNIPSEESIVKHYSLLYFEREESELLYHIYEGNKDITKGFIKFYSLPILQFEVKEVEETSMPLAIDFGTSNTTAGIYINKEKFSSLNEKIGVNDEGDKKQIRIVEVLDTTKEYGKITPLIPSVVGIRSIGEENIEYIFGYDAIKESKRNYIDDGLTIFYDIKRWVSDFEKAEKVIDTNEKTTFIVRKDIMKAYLTYIISLANQRFKCKFKHIYISCPSKQKYKFHSLFKEILSDYIVEKENILDESAAVLYNTISELIEKKNYIEGEKYKALIIDCGGGTTDLSACNFTIYNNRVSYELDIETSYENGDTDFGGNNLTFRIMQFIKILMAKELSKSNDIINKIIIEEFDIDVFRFVDKYGIEKVYKLLNEEYEKAEEIIPTKFKLYECRRKEEYYKVKSNYYFLFEVAEQVKKAFFSDPSLLKLNLTSKDNEEIEEDSIRFDKWKLSYVCKDKLQIVKNAPNISISVYEINTLLKGDIYNIIKRFLEGLYENNELFDYSIIKLTGQSCRVEIFKEALKEFIPGKIIQVKRNKKESKENYDLKLACLNGALKYLHAKNFGYADIKIDIKTPALPYVITSYTHEGEEKTLIKGRDKTKGHISRFMEKAILKLYLKDIHGNIRYEYTYDTNEDELKPILSEEIENLYGDIINQHDTDNIVNNEVKFFTWAKEELWGFYVVAILRYNEKLYIGKETFYPFENDQWEKNFFDGLK
ncbi:molecular chaperone [Clostridium lundense]|uniref:molecular chaperone n=1 Tax=Clostridium lundense TaxID=319475 RepID=UPI000485F3CB|nr:molecular chaperone [Clostridium lundense]